MAFVVGPRQVGKTTLAKALRKMGHLDAAADTLEFARQRAPENLGVLRLLFPIAVRHPQAFGHLLRAADFHLAAVREIAIVGPVDSAVARAALARAMGEGPVAEPSRAERPVSPEDTHVAP